MTHFPRSVAKYIRRQKALIRRRTPQRQDQDTLIRELIERLKR